MTGRGASASRVIMLAGARSDMSGAIIGFSSAVLAWKCARVVDIASVSVTIPVPNIRKGCSDIFCIVAPSFITNKLLNEC